MAVTAGVIGGSLKATGVTPLEVASQDRCAAALHGLTGDQPIRPVVFMFVELNRLANGRVFVEATE